jgi:FkbM family methyltransferase
MSYGINKVFDVGANVGQYAERKISLGYRGQIISFEPISSVFTELEKMPVVILSGKF